MQIRCSGTQHGGCDATAASQGKVVPLVFAKSVARKGFWASGEPEAQTGIIVPERMSELVWSHEAANQRPTGAEKLQTNSPPGLKLPELVVIQFEIVIRFIAFRHDGRCGSAAPGVFRVTIADMGNRLF